MSGVGLTPVQQRVLDDLMDKEHAGSRPRFDRDLGIRLRDELESGLADLAGQLGVKELFVNKRRLAQVHACQRHQVEEQQADFSWTARSALGTVAHKAIELSVFMTGEPTPLDLIDAAMSSMEADLDSTWLPGDFLRNASAVERAELRAEANERLVRFLESFPPLKRRWIPRTEARTRLELFDQRIVLSAKVDLALGKCEGDTAKVLIVDFKTGGTYPAHVDDLRFYALLETVRNGVPPFRVASYYLDSGTFHCEDVSEDTLLAAVRRTVEGVRTIAELHLGRREPTVVPGPTCNWCCARNRCDGAVRWRAARADEPEFGPDLDD